MTGPLNLLLLAGARPNFMKVAPLVHELRRRAAAGVPVTHSLVHSGQHYDAAMSDVFFDELGLPAPDLNLGVGSGSHAVQTAHVMMRFEAACETRRPDWVVVVGDVNSTLAAALVCAKLGIRIAHVEAGLRSFDRGMPEEVNRIVTDALSDLLLTPSADADANLRHEGIAPARIRRVGNVMIDALVANLGRVAASRVGHRLGVVPDAFAYVTLHRPANVDDPVRLGRIVDALAEVALREPVVFAVHPRTRAALRQIGFDAACCPGLLLVEPVGYLDSLWLASHARFVLTDSGGLQEETTYLGRPCLTLRPNTERPVTIEVGTNRLTTVERLRADIDEVRRGPDRPTRVPDLWDGRAAGRIVDALFEASALAGGPP